MHDAMSFEKDSKICRLTLQKNKYAIDISNPYSRIGQGTFGIVYKATNIETKIEAAIKQINKNCGLPLQRIKEEARIMINIQTFPELANILYALDFVEDSQYLYISMPLCNAGTLSSIINARKLKSEVECLEYLRQICYGLNILHSMHIIHRDLKTDNILLQSYFDKNYSYHYLLHISDFGTSREILESDIECTRFVGTALTRAPETASGLYTYKADIFSLGCIYYKMITGKEPFCLPNEREIEKMHKENRLEIDPTLVTGETISDISLYILNGCLQYKESNRFSLDELIGLLKVKTIYSAYEAIKMSKPPVRNTGKIKINMMAKMHYSSIYSEIFDNNKLTENTENVSNIEENNKTNQINNTTIFYKPNSHIVDSNTKSLRAIVSQNNAPFQSAMYGDNERIRAIKCKKAIEFYNIMQNQDLQYQDLKQNEINLIESLMNGSHNENEEAKIMEKLNSNKMKIYEITNENRIDRISCVSQSRSIYCRKGPEGICSKCIML